MQTFKQKAIEALKSVYLEWERDYNDAVKECISRIEAIEEDEYFYNL